jgi:hypothetical protein
MSTEPEDSVDSVLEEALRRDLPSADTEARLRRRLLGVGLAVGNGIATTSAAASGTAASSAAGAGAVAKVLGLSWGVKLGVAAAVAIPTVGLWLEDRSASEPSDARPAAVESALAAPRRLEKTSPPIPAANLAAPALVVSAAASSSSSVTDRAARSREAVSANGASAVVAGARRGEHPSQTDFAAAPDAPDAARRASTLADETRLLDSAFAALGARDGKRAAALIAEHESRYPQGLLKTERERAKIRLSELSRGE